MNTGSTNTLDASAKYDDQGLFFSMLLGLGLTAVFGPFVLYLSTTNTLWLKRLYRPNHTLEPPSVTGTTALTSPRGVSGPPSPSSPLFPSYGDGEAATLPAESPVVRSSLGRRKRLGISLPYVSSFYQLPSWRDWCAVEEYVPHLDSALSGCAVTAAAVDTTGAAAPQASAEPGAGEGSFVSPGSIDYRQVAGSQPFATLVPGPTGAGDVSGRRTHADDDEHTPLSAHRRHGATTRDTFSARLDSSPQPSGLTGNASVNASYGTVPPSTPPALPRTPLDPQVALYIFTLKYFVTFLVVGSGFVCWICWIASSDDAFEWLLLRNDPHRCGRQGVNETGCLLLQPYCTFLGSDIGCTAVPLPGIYDLTVKNIRPRSDLWWWVGLLNVGFVASFIVITLYFVRTADAYITKVMKMQMRHAMGYRVACVCGLGEQKKSTRRKFEKLYLTAEAYFPSAATEMSTASSPDSGTTLHVVSAKPRRRRSVSEALSETAYRRLSCPGMSCLFSIARVHMYETTTEQLVFAKPGRVKAILFTRKAPEDMYPVISAAESAISNLQEAIAQQNAVTRRKRYHHRHDDDDGANAAAEVVLYEYVGCCHKVASVPYREEQFRRWGTYLDALLEQVPRQPATGAVFIEFKDSRSAFEFVNVFEARYGGVSSRASALIAGPPGHIIESNLDVDKFILALRFVLLLFLYIVLLMTWSIPVGFLGSLDNIALVLGPAFRSWVYDVVPASVRALIIAYLPVVVLALFNLVLPFIIRFIVIAMGAVTKAECDGGHLYLQYVFMVLSAVVFQAALQGSLAEIPNLIENMGTDQIVDLLVSCVTPQSGYWYAKVITSTALSTWLDLIDPIALIYAVFFRNRARVQRRYDAIFRPTDFQYPRLYSFDIMVLSIGVLFHMTAPLLVPFVALFFIVRYITQRAKLYDRYRPSFSAPHDCTDFGVSAQVMRAVITLLCFAEMCGLFVMSLKKHVGGMMLCAVTLGASLVLAVFVYVQTRTWISTLGNARRFFPDDVYTPPTTATTTATAAVQEVHAEAPVPQREPGGRVPTTDDGDEPCELCEDPRCETDSNGSSLRTFSDVSGGIDSPRTRQPSPHAGSDSARGGSPSAQQQMPSSADRASARRRRRQHQREQAILREEDAMVEYEHLRLLPSISGHHMNPFIGHLLPRKPGLRHLYQPKHQRLAIIDVDKEVNAMMETEFVVARYWDRGMTWFEADIADPQQPATTAVFVHTPRAALVSSPSKSSPPPPAGPVAYKREESRVESEGADLPHSPSVPHPSGENRSLDEL